MKQHLVWILGPRFSSKSHEQIVGKSDKFFVVAHRLSTIRDADNIIVMNHGSIVETGNHDTLMAKNGFFMRTCITANFQKMRPDTRRQRKGFNDFIQSIFVNINKNEGKH